MGRVLLGGLAVEKLVRGKIWGCEGHFRRNDRRFCSQCLKRLPNRQGNFKGIFLGFLYPHLSKKYVFFGVLFSLYNESVKRATATSNKPDGQKTFDFSVTKIVV